MRLRKIAVHCTNHAAVGKLSAFIGFLSVDAFKIPHRSDNPLLPFRHAIEDGTHCFVQSNDFLLFHQSFPVGRVAKNYTALALYRKVAHIRNLPIQQHPCLFGMFLA